MKYLAQRYGTWEWLSLELPLDTDGPEWALSTYGVMYAKVMPALGLALAEDGRPVLEEWGTLIHAEAGEGADARKWTGIVTDTALQDGSWDITITEFPGYLDGMPLENLIRGVQTDPAELMRRVWQDVQTNRNSWLGVTVEGSTPVRIGSESEDKMILARSVMDARQETLNSFNTSREEANSDLQDLAGTLSDEVAAARSSVTAAQSYVNTLVSSGASPSEIAAARATVAARQSALNVLQNTYTREINVGKEALRVARNDRDDAQAAYDEARDVYEAAKDAMADDGGAYELRPEEVPDAHQSISDICTLGGLEWVTRTETSYGEPELKIDIHYPSAGTRREDLVFSQGVNIVSELSLTRGSAEYANSGIGIGAGEGDKLVRASIASTSPRLRRTTVMEDKKLKSTDDVSAALRKQISSMSGVPYVEEIEVIDHPLAPLYSWNLGDIILVQGYVPHYGEYAELHRIISWQTVGDTRARLRLELPKTD